MKGHLHIKSVSQVHQFFGLAPPQHPLVSVVGIFDTSRLPDIPVVSDLYSISLKTGTAGHCLYGRNSYDFQEGTLVFISPGQVIRYVNNSDVQQGNNEGWNLIFHPDLIRRSELGKQIQHYSFFHYDANEALHVSEAEKTSLRQITEKIVSEYSQNLDTHSQRLIVANIQLLLDYCTRYYDRQFYTRSNLNKDIASIFEKTLREYYASGKQATLGLPNVDYCGKAINISPYYLSDLLKKETGRSASDHIHLFVLEYAKNKLLSSQQSISEIAYDLGFAYPQHFSKLFKAKTGFSPKDYRKLA